MKLNRFRWTIAALPLKLSAPKEDRRAEDTLKRADQLTILFSTGVHPEALKHFSRGPESDRLALFARLPT
jgi:hypothetical protein